MARERLVAVSYPVDDEFAEINTGVLGADAHVAFLARLGEQERLESLRQADALIAFRLGQELPEGALAASPRLEFIQLLPAGADGVDFAAIPERLIMASNVGAYAKPIAEHVMAMTLALARRLPQRQAAMARGEFDQQDLLHTLDGAVCAVLGFGGIGTDTARLMRAFGAHIYAVNSSGHSAEPTDFTGTLADLDHVLAAADVVVISLPLTRATRGLIGARELAADEAGRDLGERGPGGDRGRACACTSTCGTTRSSAPASTPGGTSRDRTRASTPTTRSSACRT